MVSWLRVHILVRKRERRLAAFHARRAVNYFTDIRGAPAASRQAPSDPGPNPATDATLGSTDTTGAH